MSLSNPWMIVFVLYLVLINLIAFILYGADKYKAQHEQWRVPEKVLIGLALIGGSVGAILGMRIFHHKTRHKLFSIGLPLILAIQLLLIMFAFGDQNGFQDYSDDLSKLLRKF